MLIEAKNSELYKEWCDYIDAPETKEAFHYIVGLASTLDRYVCNPQWKGAVRDFIFELPDAPQNKRRPFAFITNPKWLLFYFRPPAVRSGHYSFEALSALGMKTENREEVEEWKVYLHSISDVKKLWKMVFERRGQ